MAVEKAALVLAHPGHELCVYGWLESARPVVFVLTDGSGRSGAPRIHSTTKILSRAGASAGPLYGRFTDAEIYAAILGGDFPLFERVVTELAAALVREGVEYVAGDAREGFNPVHDVCRLLIDAAVELASRDAGRAIANRDFLLFGPHDATPEESGSGSVRLALDDELFERKLAVARDYPELKGEVEAALDKKMLEAMRHFPELSAQVGGVIGAMGSDAYRVECLRLVPDAGGPASGPSAPPFYDRYGELLVAAGVYRQAIRYDEHVAPIEGALRRFLDAGR